MMGTDSCQFLLRSLKFHFELEDARVLSNSFALLMNKALVCSSIFQGRQLTFI